VTEAIRDLPSPNHDERPANTPVDILILHYTGMRTAQAAIDVLRDPAREVSSHYVVDEDGAILRLVPEDRRAWHAGLSFWRGHTALNGRSIGIEIVNPGHEWGYRDFPALQMAAVCELCLGIVARHPIGRKTPARNSIGRGWRGTALASGRTAPPIWVPAGPCATPPVFGTFARRSPRSATG